MFFFWLTAIIIYFRLKFVVLQIIKGSDAGALYKSLDDIYYFDGQEIDNKLQHCRILIKMMK